MSRTIEYRLEGELQSKEAHFDDRSGKLRIEGLKPNRIYEIRENGKDWSQARRCKADANGVIEGQYFSIRY